MLEKNVSTKFKSYETILKIICNNIEILVE